MKTAAKKKTLSAIQTAKVGLAVMQLIRDPTRTDRIFQIATEGLKNGESEVTKAVTDRAMADSGFCALWERRFQGEKIDLNALSRLPDGTLGREYARHMIAKNLDPNFYPDVPILSRLHYIDKRLRATHDIWHILTGYDTEVYGELALQGFSWANAHGALSGLIVASGIMHVLQEKNAEAIHYMRGIVSGFERGEKAAYLLGVPWEELWSEQLGELRLKYKVGAPGADGVG